MNAAPERSTAALGLHTLLSRVVIYVSAFAASVLIARGLGASGNGLYAVAMTIGTVATFVGSLGFEQAQAKAWSRAEHSRAVLYGTAIRIAATTGTVCALLAVAVWVLGRNGVFEGFGLAAAIAIVAALVPLRIALILLRGLLVVDGAIERSNVALAIGDTARTGAIVALALADALKVETVLGTLWLAFVVPLAMHAATLGRPERPPAGLVRAQLRAGTALSPFFVFHILNLRVDVLLLAALAAPRDVGVYAVAVVFAELVWLVTDAVNAGARRRQWSDDEDDALDATRSAARMSALLALLALPLLAIAAPVAIHVLYGDEFTQATDALWALLPAAAVMSCGRALAAALVRFGRPRTVTAVALASLGANVALNVVLIAPLGIAGAAIASLCSYTLGAVLSVIVLRRRIAIGALLPGASDVRRLGAFAAEGVRAGRAVFQRG